jgi:DinB superfamily
VSPEERSRLVARHNAGHAEISEALRGIGPEELDWQPGPDAWSVREIVHHVADADTMAAARLRSILTEETPAIAAYDEQVLARRFRYRERPIEPALRAIAALRATAAELLGGLAEADWQRAGTHSELGPYSVERWLEFNAGHAHDHAAQIRENRAAWASRRR